LINTKGKLIIAGAVGLCASVAIGLIYGRNDPERFVEYMNKRYSTNFSILALDGDHNGVALYLTDRPEIICEVREERTYANIFPFLPGLKRKVFNDDFIDVLKQDVAYRRGTNNIYIRDVSCVDSVAKDIFDTMVEANNEIEKYGVEPTKYSCSIKLNAIIGNVEKQIEFYVLDLDKIKEILNEEIRYG
jgi:hypothetical protein